MHRATCSIWSREMSCRSPTKPGRFNPRYPLDLFRRVITVSLETMKIVNDLPKLDIEE